MKARPHSNFVLNKTKMSYNKRFPFSTTLNARMFDWSIETAQLPPSHAAELGQSSNWLQAASHWLCCTKKDGGSEGKTLSQLWFCLREPFYIYIKSESCGGDYL